MSYSIYYHVVIGFSVPDEMLHNIEEAERASCEHVTHETPDLYCSVCGRPVRFTKFKSRSTKPEVAKLFGDQAKKYDLHWTPEDQLPRSERLWVKPFQCKPAGTPVTIEYEICLMSFQLPDGAGEMVRSHYVGTDLARMEGQGGIDGPFAKSSRHNDYVLIPPYPPARDDLSRFLKAHEIPHDPEDYGYHVVTEIL